MSLRWPIAAATSAAVAALVVAGAPTALAAQSDQALTCDGVQLSVRTPDQNSNEHGGFSVGQVVMGGRGHLIPTSFTVGAYDDTQGFWIFGPNASVKGGGNANHTQQTITCTQDETATAADLGGELPPGVDATDMVTFHLTVTAVPKY